MFEGDRELDGDAPSEMVVAGEFRVHIARGMQEIKADRLFEEDARLDVQFT